ncbi:Crp/Fnr family transcriptional regulator [Desulfovibrio sp. OttesenSCG-928-C06]|nr:Crp/Fnr family transcriptional regulator [Desulfovibrio sp. OttesenSCG-928-C06]
MCDFKPIHTIWLPDTAKNWEALRHLGTEATFETNAIIADGNVAPELFYLHKGTVKFIALSRDGQEKVLYYCPPGSIFGEGPAIIQSTLAHIYVAMEKCVVYKFDFYKILPILQKDHPDNMYSLLYAIAYKATMHARNISTLTLLDSETQVARTLYGMIISSGGNRKIRPAITQQEIANILGLHRTTLTRILSGLKRDGILVKYTKNTLEVTNVELLREAAQMS